MRCIILALIVAASFFLRGFAAVKKIQRKASSRLVKKMIAEITD